MVHVLVFPNRWSLPVLRLSNFIPRFENPTTSILQNIKPKFYRWLILLKLEKEKVKTLPSWNRKYKTRSKWSYQKRL